MPTCGILHICTTYNCVVSSTSVQHIIDKFHIMFVFHRLPTTLVSDNGLQRVSLFITANGVLHHRVSLRLMCLQKIWENIKWRWHIGQLLATYHNTYHTTILWTPAADLLFKRSSRSHLSFVHPCTPQNVEHSVVGDHYPRAFIANVIRWLFANFDQMLLQKWHADTLTYKV